MALMLPSFPKFVKIALIFVARFSAFSLLTSFRMSLLTWHRLPDSLFARDFRSSINFLSAIHSVSSFGSEASLGQAACNEALISAS